MIFVRLVHWKYGADQIAEILNGKGDWYSSEEWGKDLRCRANSDLKRSLQRLIDQWIDSGQTRPGEGCQSPMERNLQSIPPGYEQSLWDIIVPLWKRIRPRLGLNPDGTTNFLCSAPRLDVDNLAFSTHETAVWFLVQSLQAGRAHSLARCANASCKCYFTYERTPRRVIKQGTFCPECKSQASIVRMQATRARHHKIRVALAAKLLPQWNSRFGKNRSAWIAAGMNLRLSEPEQIGRNGKWVTQNLDEILAEEDRRRNGKS